MNNFYVLLLLLMLSKDIKCRVLFPSPVVQFNVEEEQPVNQTIGYLKANSDNNEKVAYELEESALTYINIGKENGRLYTVSRIDFEKNYVLQFNAYAYSGTSNRAQVIVIIGITNINDNEPKFINVPYLVFVKEDSLIKDIIFQVKAKDDDQTDTLRYGISGNKMDDHFKIGEYSGKISLMKQLDYETQKQYQFNVTVKDGIHVNMTLVTVNVVDTDDHGAIFSEPIYKVNIMEGNYINRTFLVQVHAYDMDYGMNESVTYQLQQESINGLNISINTTHGQIYIRGNIDREKIGNFTINVFAITPKHYPANSSVEVTVLDKNDEKPTFLHEDYFANVSENTVNGSLVLKFLATDRDEGQNSKLTYEILAMEEIPFSLNNNGHLFVNGDLDREKREQYKFQVVVQEAFTAEKYKSIANVSINILDENDNSPQIFNQSITFMVKENFVDPNPLGKVVATDNDIGLNGKILYDLENVDSNMFSINTMSGEIFLLGKLDREKQSSHEFRVVATDQTETGKKKSSFANISVVVVDENDNYPRFDESSYHTSVMESVPIGYNVIEVKAFDPDFEINGIVNYYIESGNEENLFAINANSGMMHTSGMLDRERKSKYSISIGAQDPGLQRSFCEVIIDVLDVNDNNPVFVEDRSYTFDVTENINKVVIGNVKATDDDLGDSGKVTYEMQPSLQIDPYIKDIFSVESTTGNIVLEKPLDRESISNYKVIVTAKDSDVNPRRTEKMIEINVMDEDDNEPQFLIKNDRIILRNDTMRIGSVIYTLKSIDYDTGINAVVSYSVLDLPEWMSLNKYTGELSINEVFHKTNISEYKLHFMVTSLLSDDDLLMMPDIFELTIMIDQNNSTLDNETMEFSTHITENCDLGTVVFDLASAFKYYNTYKMHDSNGGYFHISRDGKIIVVRPIDYEEEVKHWVVVLVNRTSNPILVTVIIHVKNLNDNNPVIYNFPQTIGIQRKTPFFHIIAALEVKDADNQNDVMCATSSEIFTVDPKRYLLQVANDLTGLPSTHKVNIECFDSYGFSLYTPTSQVIEIVLYNESNLLDIYVKKSIDHLHLNSQDLQNLLGNITGLQIFVDNFVKIPKKNDSVSVKVYGLDRSKNVVVEKSFLRERYLSNLKNFTNISWLNAWQIIEVKDDVQYEQLSENNGYEDRDLLIGIIIGASILIIMLTVVAIYLWLKIEVIKKSRQPAIVLENHVPNRTKSVKGKSNDNSPQRYFIEAYESPNDYDSFGIPSDFSIRKSLPLPIDEVRTFSDCSSVRFYGDVQEIDDPSKLNVLEDNEEQVSVKDEDFEREEIRIEGKLEQEYYEIENNSNFEFNDQTNNDIVDELEKTSMTDENELETANVEMKENNDDTIENALIQENEDFGIVNEGYFPHEANQNDENNDSEKIWVQ